MKSKVFEQPLFLEIMEEVPLTCLKKEHAAVCENDWWKLRKNQNTEIHS